MSSPRVVITGMGVVSPLGTGLEKFWSGIVECRSAAGPVDRFDVSDFKTKFACQVNDFEVPAEHRRTVRAMDLFAQYALFASFEAHEDSGLDVSKEDPRRLGVITGSGIGGLSTIEANHDTYRDRGPTRISPYMIPMMMLNAGSGNIAIHLRIPGAQLLHRLGLRLCPARIRLRSRCAIRFGLCDVIMVGGAEATITPLGIGGFNALKALSTRNDDPQGASRPFSGSRDGFVMGEGAGMFVFEEESHAKARGARIYAEVLGFGMTDDAGHITAPLPGGEMGSEAMRIAAEQGGINLDQVDYINAHGTSTALNDAMETRAVRSLFGDHANQMMMSSTKSQVGHLLGASGAVELNAVALGIHRGVVPATINYQDPDPDCDMDYVPNEPREHAIQYALSNSFGFGGHNTSLLLGRYRD